MKTMNAIRRHRSSLPVVAAAGALALLGAGPVLSAASPTWMKQQVENSRQEQQERQQRQRSEQQRPPREQAPPRSQPERPPGGNFAGAPRPPQGNPGGEGNRPPGNGGGNANYNRPPRGNGGNDGNNNRPPRSNGDDDNYNRPPNNNGGNWRPDYSRPPTNAGRPGYNPGYRPGYNPGYRPGYNPGYRPGYRPPPPRYVPSLPSGYARHYWNGSPYYYSSGYWYRPYGTSYALVTAPYGLFMSYLPGTYSSFWYGSSRYFFADNTYYLYDNTRRGYIVTQSPYGEDSQQDSAGSAADDQLYVYPARGQSEQQTADDRYECHRWAVEQTGFDPVESNYDADRREEYLRAVTACLTGRGYTVR